MYSGWITTKHVIPMVGVHQRFDVAAYHMISPYLQPKTFPTSKQIVHFEGFNGPDGLKVKTPGEPQPGHLYDPINDTGEVPLHIQNHYDQMVKMLSEGDMIRAAFEASWMAHYICDGLTPAHHFPLDKEMAALGKVEPDGEPTYEWDKQVRLNRRDPVTTWRKSWGTWGKKGLMSTHMNFEMGVATALIGHHLLYKLDTAKLAEASRLGALEFFKAEARDVASLDLYTQFYDKGWTAEMAGMVRNRLAPQTSQAIAIIWLLAYLESGRQLVTMPNAKVKPAPPKSAQPQKSKAKR